MLTCFIDPLLKQWVDTLSLRHQALYRPHFSVARQALDRIDKAAWVTACETLKGSGKLGTPLGLPQRDELAHLVDIKAWNRKVLVESLIADLVTPCSPTAHNDSNVIRPTRRLAQYVQETGLMPVA
ncbi:hypothetical protein D9M69_708550 [compost metagenome]